MRRLCLIAACALSWLPTPAPATATPETRALLAGLRQAPPLSQPFRDVRYRAALKAPLVTDGSLTWRGAMDFEREVTSPFREVSRLDGRTLVVTRGGGAERIIPLARAPELQVLFGALSALFAGDAEAIEREFILELAGDGEAWQLRLVPRPERLRERIEALELHGSGERAACLVVRQPDAIATTVFDATPAVAGAPDAEAFIARTCPMP